MQNLPTNNEIEKVSRLFKVLGDVTRVKILLFLEEGERNVTAIAEAIEMEQSAVSHQLKLLKDHRLVKSRREGKTVLYRLDDDHVFGILAQIVEHVRH
ncbi:ArsR/SmtB family transcription factor [Enterococcus lemanii]|jgi:DNA-binding transcriptional ArsR family regulator|uniref:ArsR/SmtB family transcription factor n=1 Tax=Enterococcus lemanii TaxID=1159752 RepID=A0ABV9MZY8_9ENTE|nr:metalloregulator ArsR/SmtB family transcription factor [Enterococcus lemanii]MBM7708749.1 DNA-binding transcriptional ArsR family regulator [Enterococcus lemanii]NLM67256.1 helix-turn-helix transcriptional regulator [Enterococcus sp.]